MKTLPLLVLFTLLCFASNAQVYKQSLKGYWESGYWQELLKSKKADSNSTFRVLYPSGKKRLEGSFKDGKPTGTWKHFYKTGELAAEVQYNGSYKFWLRNSCLSRVGKYKNGRRVGVWKEYYYYKYYECDSLKYYSIYDFSKAKETWYDYKKGGEEETDLLDPYFYNKDLDHYFHRFTDFNYGLFNINTTLLNLSVLGEDEGINAQHITLGVSQSIAAKRITNRDIRVEYRWSQPNSFTDSTGNYITVFNQVLLSFGGDLLKTDVIDVYPFVGLGIGRLRLDQKTSAGENEFYQRYAGQINLMLENRLNLKPYTARWGASLGFKTGYILEAGGTNWQGSQQASNITRNKLAGYYLLGVVGLYY